MRDLLRNIHRRMSDPTRSMSSAMFAWAVIIMAVLIAALVAILVFGGGAANP